VDNHQCGQLYKKAKGWLLANGIPMKHPKIEPFLEGIPMADRGFESKQK
jgi:hypothetical protein